PCRNAGEDAPVVATVEAGVAATAGAGELAYPCGAVAGGAAGGAAEAPVAGEMRAALVCWTCGVTFAAASSPPRDERRRSRYPTMLTLITSNATMARAQGGNRALGGAPLTSNSAGPDCRCRSLSDFFSASRMNDIDQPPWASARYKEGESAGATTLAS